MTERIVRTQAELDEALQDNVEWIEIRSDRGVWLEVSASGSATVRAYDSATVSASGSATVSASGSATVSASGSATVRAYDSATVSAYGSATVRAYDSATVSASSHTAVHLHSGLARIDGGVLIDHTAVNETDAETWCSYHGVDVLDGIATVYKAVNDQWTTDRGFDYSPGSTPDCPDWSDNNECGGGLHFGPTPVHSMAYFSEATKFVAVGIKLEDIRPIVNGDTAKCKARKVTVACVEVDVHCRVVEVAS